MMANIFSWSDNSYWPLQTVSLVLVGFTVVVGGLAIIVGKAANQRQAGRILDLEKSASDAKAAQQRVETDLSNAKTAQANAERSLLELQQLIKEPMTLDLEKANKILDWGLNGAVSISSIANNEGARGLADQLRVALESHGWIVTLKGSLVSSDMTLGITLKMNREGVDASKVPPDGLPEPAKTLYMCLKEAINDNPLPVAVTADQSVEKDDLQIVIGAKY